MGKIQYIGAGTFAIWMISEIIDWLSGLFPNSLVLSCLNFLNIINKIPKNILDLFLEYTWVGNFVMIICGVFFIQTVFEYLYDIGII